jgi:hypothetical protein
MDMSISDMMRLAEAFVASGDFRDLRNAHQALVRIQAGQELGVPPFASIRGIQIVQGQTVIRAHLIAAMVRKSGIYDYRVAELTGTSCSIEFSSRGTVIGTMTYIQPRNGRGRESLLP